MDVDHINAYVKNHPSGKVKIAICDIDGILRGKDISAEKFLSFSEGKTSFCDVVFGWDAGDVAYDHGGFTGWHTGYPDTPVRIDRTSFRKIPWENDLPFFLGEMIDENGNPNRICPRQLIKKLHSDAAAKGFTAFFAQEFEWFNFAETPQTLHEKEYKNLQPLTRGMFGYSLLRSSIRKDFFSDIFDSLKKFGVPLEGLHTETGPGTYEAAITYALLPEAADRACLFKTALKEIAYQNGVVATFMAKISESLPGCGGHLHQSLWDKEGGKNLFYDEKDKMKMSGLMKNYVAGQLHCLPQLLPMYAPTINSYKRLVEGVWAPTTLTWGIDNRTTALRVLNQSATSCRLETRVPGADVNPYLAMAAALGSGLYGIENNIALKQPPTSGNGYLDFSGGHLPRTLDEATRIMKESAVAKQILGDGFVDHFTRTREWEWKQHLKAVTDWEYKRYFEII
ncbi:MAG: glutamine synthetase [Flavisolibacter sp.]